MPRDHWDFKSGMEDFDRIFEQPPDEFPTDYYRPPAWGPVPDGVVPELHAWRRTVEIRPILPPDPPEFIRVWNERANRQALEDAVAEDTGDA